MAFGATRRPRHRCRLPVSLSPSPLLSQYPPASAIDRQRLPQRTVIPGQFPTTIPVQHLLRSPGEHPTDLPPFPLDTRDHHAVITGSPVAQPGDHDGFRPASTRIRQPYTSSRPDQLDHPSQGLQEPGPGGLFGQGTQRDARHPPHPLLGNPDAGDRFSRWRSSPLHSGVSNGAL